MARRYRKRLGALVGAFAGTRPGCPEHVGGFPERSNELLYEEGSEFTIPRRDRGWYEKASAWLKGSVIEQKVKLANKLFADPHMEDSRMRDIQDLSDLEFESISDDDEYDDYFSGFDDE